MPLINRNELRAEAETDNGDIDFFLGHWGGRAGRRLAGANAAGMKERWIPIVK